ncbi:MAG: alpha-mannosidase [Clostridia bacterium]|nr:alpha-mannosidase [Clostridia bacterium]
MSTYRMEENKISRIISDLEALINVSPTVIRDVSIADGQCDDAAAAEKLSFRPFNIDLEHWAYARDVYETFRIRLEIPEELRGLPANLNIRTGRENRWNARNPQFIVFQNGHLKQALDTNHNDILLCENAVPGDQYELICEGWSGLEAGDCVFYPTLSGIRREVEGLYYDLKVGLEAARNLEDRDGVRNEELSALVSVCNLIDFRAPGSESFLASCRKASAAAKKDFYDRFAGSDVTVHCIGHTHIDVAWLWRLCHTRRKACRSFSTVTELMEQYPEYLFSSSQPQLYAFIKEDYPELYEKIKARVAEGRFEPEGAMWVEADCNMTSGESFVRQLMHGKRFFREEFGCENHILWLPDVFGYSSALPQILKKSGIDCFITSKISWNEYNHLPNDTFLWQGIDGTEILTAFHTMPSVRQARDNFYATYNGKPTPETVSRTWEGYQNKDLSHDVFASYGYGDGGGGPTREMLEYMRRLTKGLPGVPKVKLDTKDGFVRTLQKSIRGKKLPKWVGELYMEMHRGTFTTMARNKRYNRLAERAHQDAEFASAFAAKTVGGLEYPRESLWRGWETIVLNQFHDIIPGSSIEEVYADSKLQYEEILGSARGHIAKAEARLAAEISADADGIAVINRTGHTASDVVTCEIPAGVTALRDGKGKLHPVQRTKDGKACFFAPSVPAMGYALFTYADAPAAASPLTVSARGMSGRFARLRFDKNANISSIYDKKARREVLKAGELGNRIVAFEDRPSAHDAWDIPIYYEDKAYPLDEVLSVQTECGPVFAKYEIVRPYMQSTVRQEIIMYADMPRIDFRTEVDWKEANTLLKCAFPVDIHANSADYDIQFGNVTRPTHWNTSWEYAKFEVVAHKWADLSEQDYGVSLLNDCKYGHDIKDGVMRLSLLRSPTYPNPAADKEVHHFTYSLLPHSGGWRDGGTVDAAYTLNDPFSTQPVTAGQRKLPAALSLVSADARNVMIDTVKFAEDGEDLIVRLYEFENRRSEVNLSCFADISEAFDCDLMENNEAALPVKNGRIALTVKPYEIKTIRIRTK